MKRYQGIIVFFKMKFLLVLLMMTVFIEASSENSNTIIDIPDKTVPLEFLPALDGDYLKYDSQAVNRTFHIYIRLPQGYDHAAKKSYPVIYILDGDSLFPILAANHMFLTYDDKLPESIIVGISYGSFEENINMRSLDFSTDKSGKQKNRGGANHFHKFLSDELLPLIEHRYHADPNKRILFGQSRGGYMVLYSAYHQPDLFWGRIASNPTLEPDNEQFFLSPTPSKRMDLILVVTSGSKDYPKLRKQALEWGSFWDERSNKPWTLAFITIQNGTHSANSADSYRLGLNKIFKYNNE